MQHKRDDFGFNVSIKGLQKLERIANEAVIRIRHIDMASKRITTDYPDLAGWFCLRVMTGREFAVEKALDKVDVEAIVPHRKGEETRKRGRVIPAQILPVIPGYVLVRFVPSPGAISGLRNFNRVIGFVGKGEIPYRVPMSFVSRFIDLAVTGEYDHRVTHTTLKAGDKVTITDGPFTSFPALVTSIDLARQGRIDVEVNLFGRASPMELDLAQVEAL